MAFKKKVKPLGHGDGGIRARGGKYQIRWYEDGRRSLGGFGSEFEAREELERIHARLRLGHPGVTPPKATSIAPASSRTFSELVEDWTTYRVQHGKRMALEERSRWALHLAGPLSTQTVESVTPKWVRDLALELVSPTPGTKGPSGTRKEAISGPTAHRVLTLLSSFYSWAMDEGLAKENPARVALRHKDTKKLLASKHDNDEQPYLKSWDEVMRLYRAVSDADATVGMAYLISARVGLRPGEVVGLRWGDIDLDAPTIRVERQVRSGKEGPTKSGKARTIRVPAIAAELAAWKVSAKVQLLRDVEATDLVCPPPVRIKKDGKPGASWGKYLGPKSIGLALEAAFKKTKIPPATLYAYGRHTAASIMAVMGMSAFRLKEIMGHSDIKTTLRYISLRDQDLTPTELAAMGA
jgi:integrase